MEMYYTKQPEFRPDCAIDCNASISDKTREFITIELTLFSSAIHRHPRIIFAIISSICSFGGTAFVFFARRCWYAKIVWIG